ncbi:hypothetical protein [Pseudomonas sp. JUb96]|uniref:hypothetical protein n=1 Tax=Pseudomonas sp. JUb96 TaxID=2940539 RepID=UPI0029CABED3|nr:hypothetical protein [Pseudomonas sp. JUb96]MCW2272017.1 hypothetical protein [Pseudomonas sp. JUb96]
MMTIERRALLKGMAVGGVAGIAMASSGLGLANTVLGRSTSGQVPTRVLVSPEVAGSAFVQGIQASPIAPQVQVMPIAPELGVLMQVQQHLASGQAQRLIGLLDDASAALLIDLARSAGARVQWLGQHSATSERTAHRLLSAQVSHGCALQLGQHLNACGQGFRLHEQRLHSPAPTLEVATTSRTRGGDQWAATLGYALAVLGSTDTGQAPLIASRPSALAGTYVSFSIAV